MQADQGIPEKISTFEKKHFKHLLKKNRTDLIMKTQFRCALDINILAIQLINFYICNFIEDLYSFK